MNDFYAANDLPMMLNFRGDEDLAKDFSFSAEQAMDVLGIKRSRLNQISGRELRVARMRVDGYLRPIYRPIDVEEYLSWSRAPVTHKRSSEAIDDAVHRLESHAQKLREELTGDGNILAEVVSKSLQILDQNLQQQIQILRRTLLQRDDSSFLQNQNRIMAQTLDSLDTKVSETLEKQLDLGVNVSAVQGALTDILLGLQNIALRLSEQQETTKAMLMKQDQDLDARIEAKLENLHLALPWTTFKTSLSAKSIVHRRKLNPARCMRNESLAQNHQKSLFNPTPSNSDVSVTIGAKKRKIRALRSTHSKRFR